MSTTPNVAILKRKTKGLSSIKGMKGNPREYGTNSKSKDVDGEYVGEWKEPNLPGGKHFLALWWNDLKNQWCWGGSPQELQALVEKIALKFEKGHPKFGDYIKNADLKYINDPFFAHSFFQGKKFMEGGRVMLNLDVSEDKIYYLSYKGNHKVHDKSENLNAAFVMGAQYELINPKKQDSAKARDYKAEADATRALYTMEFEFMKMVADIMEIPGYDPKNPDPDALTIALTDYAVKDEKKNTKYGGKTGKEYFVHLSTIDREQLVVMHLVLKAKNAGIIRRRNGYWQYNTGNSRLSERLKCDVQMHSLYSFMSQEDNAGYYSDMINQLEAKGIKTF